MGTLRRSPGPTPPASTSGELMPHRRPLGPFSATVRPVRGLRAVLVGGLTAAVLALTAAPAFAVPTAPATPNPTDQQLAAAADSQAAAAAEVGRIAGLVAGEQTTLEKLEVQAEAAGAASDAAERALQEAQAREEQAAAALAS